MILFHYELKVPFRLSFLRVLICPSASPLRSRSAAIARYNTSARFSCPLLLNLPHRSLSPQPIASCFRALPPPVLPLPYPHLPTDAKREKHSPLPQFALFSFNATVYRTIRFPRSTSDTAHPSAPLSAASCRSALQPFPSSNLQLFSPDHSGPFQPSCFPLLTGIP